MKENTIMNEHLYQLIHEGKENTIMNEHLLTTYTNLIRRTLVYIWTYLYFIRLLLLTTYKIICLLYFRQRTKEYHKKWYLPYKIRCTLVNPYKYKIVGKEWIHLSKDNFPLIWLDLWLDSWLVTYEWMNLWTFITYKKDHTYLTLETYLSLTYI